MKKLKIILLVILLILLLAVAGALYWGYTISNRDMSLPQVFVGDVDVSSLSRQQALDKLNNTWQTRCETPLTVTLPGEQSFTVDPVKSGLVLSVEAAADAACAYGLSGNIVENFISYAQNILTPVDVNAISASPDEAYISSCIKEGLNTLESYMGEEEYTVILESEEMLMKKGWKQLKLDEAQLSAAIISALEAGQTQLTYTQLSSELKAPDFADIHKELEREPVNASYTDDGKFEVIDEIVGCKFDTAQALSLWKSAQPGEEVRIPLEVAWPEVTGEQLRGQLYRDLLGAMTTKFPNSAEPRRNNLDLATSKLNGLIMYPGDIISYNEVVGVRTEEAGFQPAPAYVDGDVKDEVGGGACQVSSTLYAASLFAFMESVERECHYFPVNYMQMGTDATVTIPEGGGRSIDFKLKNNKNFPVKLVGIFNNEESTLTFEIWGTLEEGDYMPVEFDNTYTWQYDYDRFIDPAYPDREGYKIKLECEIYSFSDDVGSGYRTLTHRKVFNSAGELVEDLIINDKFQNGNYKMDTYYHH